MGIYCVNLHHVIGALASVLILSTIFLVIWKCRKRKLNCGSVLCCSLKYEVHEHQPEASRDNPVYRHQTTDNAPEEVVTGCEIYQCQEEILNYDQKRLLRLCSVHKSTQTVSDTWIYENDLHHQTLGGVTRRRGCDSGVGFEQIVRMDYDYDYATNHEASTCPYDTERQNAYTYSIRQSRRCKTTQQNSSVSRDMPPFRGREKLSSLAVNVNDPIYYIDPNQYNSCLPPEGPSITSSDVSSDSDDSEKSDNEDSHKIYFDETLLGYVDTLRRNHAMYIQKYKTEGHNKMCSKTFSCDISTKPRLKRANTGVLKLLEIERTKIHQALSVPVNMEPTSEGPCYHIKPPSRRRTPPSSHRSPPSCHKTTSYSSTATTPRPCLSEEDYLIILS